MTASQRKKLLEFLSDECLQIHALLDRVHVPTGDEDTEGRLTMAQRVNILVGVYENLVAGIGNNPPTTEH